MTHSDQSYLRNPVRVRADELRPGDGLNTHADVFWDVVRVGPSERYPGDVLVEIVDGRKYTYAPTALLTVLRSEPCVCGAPEPCLAPRFGGQHVSPEVWGGR